MPTKASVLAFITIALTAVPAFADDAKDDGKKDETKKDAAPAAAPAGEDKLDPYEDPQKTYRFIGLRFRDAVVPKFMINWFADGGRNVNVPMIGPEFTTRRDHLQISVALMYADYSMDPFLFKGKSEPATAYELVASSLKLGYAMIDILYEIPLEKKDGKDGRFALLVGGGVGIAAVFGKLYRAQAFPNTPNADPGTASQWTACRSAADGTGGYCSDPVNNHYWPSGKPDSSAYDESSWVHGGSKPIVFPWIAIPQISFRYKPIKQLNMQADFGFSSSGFFFGLSAGYGL